MKNNGYLQQLTWLRGIAAFFVIISHVTLAVNVNYLPEMAPTIPVFISALDMGTFGVLLFFTLSGTTLYISHKNNPVPLGHFYIKRFFRIWPAFAISLALYISFQPIFISFYPELQGFWLEKQFTIPYSLKDIGQYLLLAQNVSGQMGLFNNAYWSLPVEFQYYLIFPLLLLSLKYLQLIGPIIFGLLLYAIYKFNLSGFIDTKVFMLGFSFCGGVSIGYVYHKIKLTRKSTHLPFARLILLITFAIASLVSNHVFILPDLPVLSGIWNWYIALSFIAVGAALFGEINVPQYIQKALTEYGNTSYSLYLYHNLIIAVLVLLCIQLTITNEILLITVLLGTLIGTYLLSTISFQFVEKKGINLGKQLCLYLSASKTKATN